MIRNLICYLRGHKWSPRPTSYYVVDSNHELIAATTECLRCHRTRTSLSTLNAFETVTR